MLLFWFLLFLLDEGEISSISNFNDIHFRVFSNTFEVDYTFGVLSCVFLRGNVRVKPLNNKDVRAEFPTCLIIHLG